MFLLKKILVALILPPTGPVLLALFGLWLSRARSRRWQYGGILLATLSLLSMLALSTPIVGHALMAPLQPHPALAPGQLSGVQAIVILGGGSYYGAPEYGGDTVGGPTLERIRYGAWLSRKSRLPLLVTGGAPYGGRAEADSMREALEQEFGVAVRWVESASRDTAESARLSAPLLAAAGVTRIALVSHGWHLPRAIPLFEQHGLQVLAAPTAFSMASPSLIEHFLPSGLTQSRSALNEYLGQLFYRLKDALS